MIKACPPNQSTQDSLHIQLCLILPAGFSSDFPTQVKQVLDVVTSSLKQVVEHEEAVGRRLVVEQGYARTREAEQEVFKEKLKRFGYHDPRMDALAGNGIMSELGTSFDILSILSAVEQERRAR